jgi:hypothetical protein
MTSIQNCCYMHCALMHPTLLIILLCLTPDYFSHQGESAVAYGLINSVN